MLPDLVYSSNSSRGGSEKRKHTKTSPLAQLLSVRNLNKGDLVFRAQCLNKLLVWLLLAVLVQHTHVRLATIKGLGGFTKATGETVVDECVFEDTFQGILDRHLTFAGGGIGGDLDLLGGFDLRDLIVGVEG